MQAIATPSQVNFSPIQRRYTLEEFWALPEREDHARYNLIGGYLFMVPPPNPPHGDGWKVSVDEIFKDLV